jgi:penicillin amidase
MRASKLLITILVLAVAVGATAQTLDRAGARRAVAPVIKTDEVPPVATTRDAQGIWHITGGTLFDVFEAMGYAVASDRLFQMELYRRSARGTMSELFGAEFLGQDFLTGDIVVRNIMYSEDELTQLFEALSPDAQTVIQGYVAGVNRRIFENYTNFYIMPYEYWIASFYAVFVNQLPYNMLPEPWSVEDVVAWMAILARNFDGEALDQGQLGNAVLAPTLGAVYGQEGLAMFQDLRWFNDPSAQTMIPMPVMKAFDLAPQPPAIDIDAIPDLSEAAARIRESFDTRDRAIRKVGADVTMGSYAWAISGDKTASGNPTVYSGPQMGFHFPAIVTEGSIRGGGLDISGMTVPGIPAIIIGRTPHHAWSMQVGHAHTQDWFIDSPLAVSLHRMETINVAGGEPFTFPVFRTHHGPIVDPFPYNPEEPPDFVVSWAYAHWGREAASIEAFLNLARATSIAEFDVGIEMIAVSQHFTYADRDGNIAYWMSGWDPIRAQGVDPRFPQIGDGTQEWTGERRARAHDSNTPRGYYGGWNNKASYDYNNTPNNYSYHLGPFHRAHVVEEYLSTHDNLTFEEIRDLALNIATTTSFHGGGNTWSWVADDFKAAVAANSTPDRDAAIEMLDAWDGHFVAGGPAEWRMGTLRADAWMVQDAWIREVIRITFEDEFRAAGLNWEDESTTLLFNVLLRALAGPSAALPTLYDWFQDKAGTGDKPVGAEAIIIRALDNVIEHLGLGPHNAPRGEICFAHSLLGALDPNFNCVHSIPFSERSTYAHVVEYGENGPTRIESMFPLGPSGNLWYVGLIAPSFDLPYNFSLAPNFDPFMPRPFPTFE